jgi:hypothetical protein
MFEMSKLTATKSLFMAALLLAVHIAPALALPKGSSDANDAPHRLAGQEHKSPSGSMAAKIAFVQSLSAARSDKPQSKPSRQTVNNKMRPVSCEESWFFSWTKCCSDTLCCTWYGDGNGPVCI